MLSSASNDDIDDTTPVGHYSPRGDSPYGCVDMASSVWGWTGSWYRAGQTRAMRGSSWGDRDLCTRSAHWDNYNPDYWNLYIGFRVAEHLSDPDT